MEDLKSLVRNHRAWQCDHCVEHVVEEAYRMGVRRAITIVEKYVDNYPIDFLIGKASTEEVEQEIAKASELGKSAAKFLAIKLKEIL